MDMLPSCSKSLLKESEADSNIEEAREMVGQIKDLSTPKKCKKSRKQKRFRRNSSSSIVSKVLAELKANEGASRNKKAIRNKRKKAKLKRFDKFIRNPNDGELIIDLATDEDDILILEEDDLIEIVEHIRKDSGVFIDLTEEEENIENQNLYSEERETSNERTVENQSRPLGREENRSQMPNVSSEATPSTDPVEHCRLFVGGLKAETTNESLKNYFEKWGVVLDAYVKTDIENDRSRGFGFVTFSHKSMVDDVQKNRPHIVDGRVVCCRRNIPKKDMPYPGGLIKELFIPELQEHIKERDLVQYFRQFGDIMHYTIVTRPGINRLKKFGFISFRDYDAVDKILLLKFHKIKGFVTRPRACLTREQLAQRELKYYLKYFGGFNDWPMEAIENWIRRHPELCHDNSQYQRQIRDLHAQASSEMYMWRSYCAQTRTYSTSSSVTYRELRMIKQDRGSSPFSSRASCSTSIKDKEKIKIEIDPGDDDQMRQDFSARNEYSKTIKVECPSPAHDSETLDIPCCSQIKTEPMT